MKKAVLYARVSTKVQKKDKTIESQIAELKKHIIDSGDVLVKEYVDNGHSGASMERPALDQLRKELTTNLFDVVYFLNTDRIARDVVYQNLIIAEILKQKKQIIINGRDYIHNPENKFKITVLGAVAELERAKIIERSQRGKRHKLRKGIALNNGHNTFGYNYIPKTQIEGGKFVINRKEAKVVKYIFKEYTSGASWSKIIRYLEDNNILTKTGKKLWDTVKLKAILTNHTYTGIKYYNTRTLVKDPSNPLRKIKYGKKVYRDKSEWIPVKVPAIVSKVQYDKAQKRLEENKKKYRSPKQSQLLSHLIKCGECGRFYIAYQRFYRIYYKGERTGGIYHRVAYKCSRRNQQRLHSSKSDMLICKNPEVSAPILEKKVFDLIESILVHPDKLKTHLKISKSKRDSNQKRLESKLEETERKLLQIKEQKKLTLNKYALNQITKDEYVQKCIEFDTETHKTKFNRDKLIKKIPNLHREDIIDVSIREFCGSAKARLEKARTFKSKHQFLLDHIDRITYQKGKVIIDGSIPVLLKTYEDPDQTSEMGKIPYRLSSTRLT